MPIYFEEYYKYKMNNSNNDNWKYFIIGVIILYFIWCYIKSRLNII